EYADSKCFRLRLRLRGHWRGEEATREGANKHSPVHQWITSETIGSPAILRPQEGFHRIWRRSAGGRQLHRREQPVGSVLLNHLVRALQQRWRESDTEHLCGLQVD